MPDRQRIVMECKLKGQPLLRSIDLKLHENNFHTSTEQQKVSVELHIYEPLPQSYPCILHPSLGQYVLGNS